MMRRFALLVAVLAVTGQMAVAAQESTRKFSRERLAAVLTEVGAELEKLIKKDTENAIEFLKFSRQAFKDTAGDNRRRLLTDGVVNSASLTKGWELMMDAGEKIWNVVDAKRIKITEFFSGVLGADWKEWTPLSWQSKTLTWDTLGLFELNSNLQDLISHEEIKDFSKPQSLGELYTKMDTVVDHFCTEEEFTPSEKVPTTCTGPVVSLTYVPKKCTINELTKQVMCEPAKLVLTKTPGSCVLKHYSAFSWTGKQCRYKAEMGKEGDKVIGGGEYQIDLGTGDIIGKIEDHIEDKVNDTLDVLRPDAPLNVVTATVAGYPYQRIVSWDPPAKAALQAILKYDVTCVAGDGYVAKMRNVRVFSYVKSVTIGSDASGENAALADGTNYTCSVYAINAAGAGPSASATYFTTSSPA